MLLNLNHPNLTRQAKAVLNKLDEQFGCRIKELYEPSCIILFGSYTTGEQDEWSDIDLIIVSNEFERVKWLRRRSTFLREVGFWGSGLHVDPHCKTVAEFNRSAWMITITREAVRTGIPLLDRDNLYADAVQADLIPAYV